MSISESELYRLAKQLGIPNPRISEYRSGKATPDAYACAKLADALGVDPLALLAQVEAATEKNEIRKAYWKSVAKRTGAVTVTVILSTLMAINSEEDLARESDFYLKNQILTVFRSLSRWVIKAKNALHGIGLVTQQIRHAYT